MPPKLCTHPGCNAVVSDGTTRCPLHPLPKQTQSTRKHYKHHYDDRGRLIYNTPEWKRIRKARLQMNPLCQRHEAMGLVVPAEHVDHIVEIEDGGDPYDFNNTQSLCEQCHKEKTGAEKKKRNRKNKNYPSLSDFK